MRRWLKESAVYIKGAIRAECLRHYNGKILSIQKYICLKYTSVLLDFTHYDRVQITNIDTNSNSLLKKLDSE